MKLISLLILLSFSFSISAQTKPKPIASAKPKESSAKEQKQAATKPATVTTKGKVEKEILKLEHKWAQALLDEDVAKLDTLLADNLQYTRSNGKVENKASYLDPIKKGTTTYSMVKRDHVKVQVNGETAIVTAQWKARLQNKPNPPMETKARYLHVYMKQNGRWVLTTHQNTEIK
ncbi:MAG: nuclear transport factor 2 family protein [Acidobacteria bacterium]|nr:nuclear transport factor 2 family protein [Acidobacteriota bacterium]